MKCFCCGKSEKVFDFNEETLEKCTLMSRFRRMKNFKYCEIEVPTSIGNLGYHSACYKKFTVLKKQYKEEFDSMQSAQVQPDAETIDEEQEESNESDSYQPEEELNPHESEGVASGLTNASQLPCIFCNSQLKKTACQVIETSLYSSKEAVEKIKQQATEIGDVELINKLQECHVYRYHSVCEESFNQKYAKYIQNKGDGDWHKLRIFHKEAFAILTEFLDIEIFENEKIYFLHDLLLRYKSLLLEITDKLLCIDLKNYHSNNLEEQLQKKYGDAIIIRTTKVNNNRKIVHKKGLDPETVIYNTAVQQNVK